MQSAVSAIIIFFASIISITTGETTVPTLSPTYAPFPLTPTATCTGSTPGWVDVYGDGCGFYEANDDPGCPNMGDFAGYDENTGEWIIGEPGSLPKDNCCYCFDPQLTDNAYQTMRFVEAIASGISAISVWSLQFAILRNPKVRSNTFNLYLAFCLAPDAVYSLLTTFVTVRYLVEYRWACATGEWRTTPPMLDIMEDHFLTWCENFWFCASLWMSFSVFVQIYKLLTANKRVKRYQPPTRKQVIRDSTIILIVSGVVAASITLLWWWVYENENENEETWLDRANKILLWTSYIPTVYIPTLLITGMCIGVWWNKLIPRKNARYRSLTMFFARLLASAYLMVLGAVSKQLLNLYWPEEEALNFETYAFFMFYLFGFFQMCLALTKKDIRDAFVEMWCCRGIGVRSSAAASPPTAEESYEPEVDGYDVERSTGDDVKFSVVNLTVMNQDVNENDGKDEAITAFVDATEQNEESIVKDTDEEQIGENSSGIDETKHEIVQSKEEMDSVQA